ncbi:MAG: DUF4350 domain-containing protein [Actinomycetes bacterium]
MQPTTRRWVGGGLAALLALAVATALLTPATGRTSLDPDAATPGGTRALAELLREQGVSVERTTDADRALSLGGSTTLVVAYPELLPPGDIRSLEKVPADVVLLGPVATPDGYLDVTPAERAPLEDRDPQCLLEAALRAGDARTGGTTFTVDDSAATLDATEACFSADGLPTLVQTTSSSGAVHTIMGSADFMSNEWIDDSGNAALAMNLVGRNPALVWWMPTPQYTGQQSLTSLLPDGLWPLLGSLAVVVLMTAVWRARRLGPVTEERLPVAVRASETTEGRARIYQRHRTRGQAADHLRSQAVDALRLRLGLPTSASDEAIAQAVTTATGRRPEQVQQILYGPPPQADQDLVDLGHKLSALDQEVRRT